MKLSLSWIFDHIQARWQDLDIEELMGRLGATTSEIDRFEKVTFDFSSWTLAQIISIAADQHMVESSELKKKLGIAARPDGVIGDWYLIKKDYGHWRYVTYHDFHGAKEGLVPSVWCAPDDLGGAWKKQLMHEDYIITIDNKAVTHRPDLWGHKGFARELAAILRVPLYAEERFLASKPIRHYKEKHSADAVFPCTVEVQDTRVCKRFAALPITHITPRSSLLWMVQRLAVIDARAHDAIIDMTNYVMYDYGQPMHAFDAQKIKGSALIVRAAHAGEKLTLLDNETIELSNNDCVVADTQHAVALAGIMGGAESAVSKESAALIIESAAYAPTPIRLTAAHFKKRTEASIRFEKSLDPNYNTQALLRFLRLLDDAGMVYTAAEYVASIGALAQEIQLILAHDYLVKRLGATITVDRVVDILKRLGCGVRVEESVTEIRYTVTVPTYRASKDITIKEDLIEEIGRFIGYSTIPFVLPQRAMKPFDTHLVDVIRALKRHFAYGLGLYEAQNYAFYDEAFLREIELSLKEGVILSNPVSENWQRLVSSLLPHLIKNVLQNKEQKPAGFFELASRWSLENDVINERRSLAAVHTLALEEGNFYVGKQKLQTIFDLLGMLVIWRKPMAFIPDWYHPYEVAELVCQDKVIGMAGKVAPALREKMHNLDAFMWELDADFLVAYQKQLMPFEQLSKYQAVSSDMSMFVPLNITVSDIEDAIARADGRIYEVTLVDFFEKPEWQNQRAVTVRYKAMDTLKTFTKEEIEDIRESVATAVKKLGVEIR